MDDRWRRLEAWVETNAPAFASTLRPPASAAAVEAAERQLDVSFPPSVRQSYRIHDGEDSAVWGVFGYRMLTLTELVEQTESLREIDADFEYEFWDDALVPLLEVGNGDYLCVSDAPDGEETAFCRWDHERSAQDELEPSFPAFFDAVLDAYEAGDYDYDHERVRLTVDVDIHQY